MPDTVYIVGSNFNTNATQFDHIEPACEHVAFHLRYKRDTYRLADRSGKHVDVEIDVDDVTRLYNDTNTILDSDTGGITINTGDVMHVGQNDTFNWIHDKKHDQWTIETWLWLDDTASEHTKQVFGTSDSSNDVGFRLLTRGGFLRFVIDRGTPGTCSLDLTCNDRLSKNRWHHVAITRTEQHVRMFIDGVRQHTSVWYNSASAADQTHRFRIGHVSPAGFAGMIQDVRLTKDHSVFRDTVDQLSVADTCAVVPVQPGCGDVVLHIQQLYDGPISDRSSNYNHVKVFGEPGFDDTQDPFYDPVGSTHFNGSTDFLRVDQTPFIKQSVFDIQDDNFMFDMWFRCDTIGSRQGLISTHDGSSGFAGLDSIDFEIRAQGDMLVHFRKPDNTSVACVTNTTLTIDTWYHLAVVRHDTQLMVFLNGRLDCEPVTFTGSIRSSYADDRPCPLFVARYADWMFQGHIQDLRIVKGQSVYNQLFVPPNLNDQCWICPASWIDYLPFDDNQYWCE